MKNLYLIIAFLFLIFSACAQEKTSEIANNGTLIFQSGFEAGSKVIAKGSEADIIGTDRSFADHNDWVNDLDNHPDIGKLRSSIPGRRFDHALCQNCS